MFLLICTLSPLITVWGAQMSRGDLLIFFSPKRLAPEEAFMWALSLLDVKLSCVYILSTVLFYLIFKDRGWLIGYIAITLLINFYSAWWTFRLFAFLAPGDSIKNYFKWKKSVKWDSYGNSASTMKGVMCRISTKWSRCPPNKRRPRGFTLEGLTRLARVKRGPRGLTFVIRAWAIVAKKFRCILSVPLSWWSRYVNEFRHHGGCTNIGKWTW